MTDPSTGLGARRFPPFFTFRRIFRHRRRDRGAGTTTVVAEQKRGGKMGNTVLRTANHR